MAYHFGARCKKITKTSQHKTWLSFWNAAHGMRQQEQHGLAIGRKFTVDEWLKAYGSCHGENLIPLKLKAQFAMSSEIQGSVMVSGKRYTRRQKRNSVLRNPFTLTVSLLTAHTGETLWGTFWPKSCCSQMNNLLKAHIISTKLSHALFQISTIYPRLDFVVPNEIFVSTWNIEAWER